MDFGMPPCERQTMGQQCILWAPDYNLSICSGILKCLNCYIFNLNFQCFLLILDLLTILFMRGYTVVILLHWNSWILYSFSFLHTCMCTK